MVTADSSLEVTFSTISCYWGGRQEVSLKAQCSEHKFRILELLGTTAIIWRSQYLIQKELSHAPG